MRIKRLALWGVMLGCVLNLSTGRAWGNISGVTSFRSVIYSQDTEDPPTSVSGAFLTLITTNGGNPADVTGVQATGPGGMETLGPSGPTSFAFQTGFFPDVAAMDADYPLGSYLFEITGGTFAGAMESVDVSENVYPDTIPAMDPLSWNELFFGFAPGFDHLLFFNTFGSDPRASTRSTFFTIFDDVTGAVAFSQGGLSTSVLIPAGTLVVGNPYTAELAFVNYVNEFSSAPNGFNGAQLTAAYDVRASVRFNTIPEPSGVVLAVLGGVGCGVVRRRRVDAVQK